MPSWNLPCLTASWVNAACILCLISNRSGVCAKWVYYLSSSTGTETYFYYSWIYWLNWRASEFGAECEKITIFKDIKSHCGVRSEFSPLKYCLCCLDKNARVDLDSKFEMRRQVLSHFTHTFFPPMKNKDWWQQHFVLVCNFMGRARILRGGQCSQIIS